MNRTSDPARRSAPAIVMPMERGSSSSACALVARYETCESAAAFTRYRKYLATTRCHSWTSLSLIEPVATTSINLTGERSHCS